MVLPQYCLTFQEE